MDQNNSGSRSCDSRIQAWLQRQIKSRRSPCWYDWSIRRMEFEKRRTRIWRRLPARIALPLDGENSSSAILKPSCLLPLHSGVRKSPCKQRAVEATQVVCNSFVTLALFQYSAFKNITTQNQWFRLCVDTNIVTWRRHSNWAFRLLVDCALSTPSSPQNTQYW